MYSHKRNNRLFSSPAWMYSWRQPSAGPSTRAYAMSIDDTGLNGIFANAIGAGSDRGPYVTRDGGTTWSQNTSGITFASLVATFSCAVARSSPNIMYCGNSGGTSGGYLYKSTDYGSTWTELTAAGQRNWTGLVCNSSGSIVTAAAAGAGLYKSTDGGTTWATLSISNSQWGPLCMSENGNVIATATTNGSRINVSTNGGTSFTSVTASTLAAWTGLSCSADGSIIFGCAASPTTACVISTDSGATWRTGINPSRRTNNQGYRRTACSLDGKRLLVTEGQSAVGGYIWVSEDRGVSWSDLAINNPNNWEGLAMTFNGKTILAGTGSVSRPWVGIGV